MYGRFEGLTWFLLMIVSPLFFTGTCFAGESLKIGVVSPYSGDLAGYGVPIKNAVVLAAEAMNQQGGVLGRKIELLMEDDLCEPNTAENVAKKLVSQRVNAVIGHLCNEATEAALGIYRNANVIVISPASTNPALTLSGKNPNFFRTIAHDAAQASFQVGFAIKQLQIKKAVVIHDKGVYGKGLAEWIQERLKQSGTEVVLFEGVIPGAVSYSALVNKIKKTGIDKKDAVFFAGYHPEAAKIISEARKKRINANFIASEGVKDPSFLEIAGKYALACYVSAPREVSQFAMAAPITQAYKARFESDPGTFSLQGYVALLVLAKAFEKAGSTDFEKVVKALQSEKIETPLGSIKFDDKGDIAGAGFVMYQVQPQFIEVRP
ncbi:branched-chain amino acid ABC transporter substrate-binding protein [Deltaproteobacteria bacterium TL4]